MRETILIINFNEIIFFKNAFHTIKRYYLHIYLFVLETWNTKQGRATFVEEFRSVFRNLEKCSCAILIVVMWNGYPYKPSMKNDSLPMSEILNHCSVKKQMQ